MCTVLILITVLRCVTFRSLCSTDISFNAHTRFQTAVLSWYCNKKSNILNRNCSFISKIEIAIAKLIFHHSELSGYKQQMHFSVTIAEVRKTSKLILETDDKKYTRVYTCYARSTLNDWTTKISWGRKWFYQQD